MMKQIFIDGCRWLFFPTLAVLFATGCSRPDTDALFKEAIVNVQSAVYDKALAQAEKILASDPSHVSSRIIKGICLHHLQRPADAEETLRAAAQDFREDFAAQYFYGWIMFESGQYQDALPPLRKAHELRPDHEDTTALLARCCLEQALPDEGIPLFAALRRHPFYGKGAEVDNSIALLYLYQGDFVKAKNHFFAALRRDPDNPLIAQNIAVLHDQYLAAPKEALRYYVAARNSSQKIGDKKRMDRLRAKIADVARELR